jgi:hypothetical protein
VEAERDTLLTQQTKASAAPPPQAGCWCSRRKRRPYVRLIVLGNEPRQASGLRPRIPDNRWRLITRKRPTRLPPAHVRPAQRSLALRPAHSRHHLYVTSYTEGFSHSSMTAPLLPAGAFRRVGLAPTGKRRLGTAHTLSCRCGSRSRTSQVAGRAGVDKRDLEGRVPPGARIRWSPSRPSRRAGSGHSLRRGRDRGRGRVRIPKGVRARL